MDWDRVNAEQRMRRWWKSHGHEQGEWPAPPSMQTDSHDDWARQQVRSRIRRLRQSLLVTAPTSRPAGEIASILRQADDAIARQDDAYARACAAAAFTQAAGLRPGTIDAQTRSQLHALVAAVILVGA